MIEEVQKNKDSKHRENSFNKNSGVIFALLLLFNIQFDKLKILLENFLKRT